MEEALTVRTFREQENVALLLAADQSFSDWDNEEDRIYDAQCSGLSLTDPATP
jgi:hypothetical protein